MLLLAATPFPKTLFDHFVRQLESFLFYYIFTKTPTKDLERSFSVWADELRAIGEEDELRTQKEKLNAFIEERFTTNMSSKDAELSDYMKRYSLHSMQRYRTRYLLAKLTQFVDMAYRGLKTPGYLADYIDLEIEHILPDTPTNSLKAHFSKVSPGADYDDYKDKLGNLALLEKPINIVAGNDFFAQKKEEYKKCKNYLTSSIAGLTKVGINSSITRMNRKLANFDNWTAASIDKRQDLLIKLSREIWKTTPIDLD